jgi:hypothetical protein
MTPQRGQHLRQIFERALELDPARRSEFLRQACGADHDLLAEVEGLLAADQRTHSLIGRPVLQWEETVKPAGKKRWMNYALPAALLLLALGGWFGYKRLSQRGANLSSAPVSTPPAAPNSAVERPPLDVTVYRMAENGARVVSSDLPFRSGDVVRFAVTPPQSGYLYLLQQGSQGHVEIIYPDRRLAGSFQPAEAGRSVELPAQKNLGFKLDDNPGIETVYFILAPAKDDPLIGELDTMTRERRSRFTPDRGKSVVEKLNAYAGEASAPANDQPQLTVKVVKLNHLAESRDKK